VSTRGLNRGKASEGGKSPIIGKPMGEIQGPQKWGLKSFSFFGIKGGLRRGGKKNQGPRVHRGD